MKITGRDFYRSIFLEPKEFPKAIKFIQVLNKHHYPLVMLSYAGDKLTVNQAIVYLNKIKREGNMKLKNLFVNYYRAETYGVLEVSITLEMIPTAEYSSYVHSFRNGE